MLDFLDEDEEVQTSMIPMDGHRSVKKLRELNFDPLDAQVKLYKDLLIEEAYVRSLRSGDEMGRYRYDSDGKRIRYSAQYHASIMMLIQKTAGDLTRYSYARVPENVPIENRQSEPLIIEMTDYAIS